MAHHCDAFEARYSMLDQYQHATITGRKMDGLEELDSELFNRISTSVNSNEGDFNILFGATGAGKTTLLCQGKNGILVSCMDVSGNGLKRSGMIPADFRIIVARDFRDTTDLLNRIADGKRAGKLGDVTRVIVDNASGLTLWNDQETIEASFDGNTAKFSAYGGVNGDRTAANGWQFLLDAFQNLKDAGLDVFLIAHATNYKVTDAQRDDHLKAGPMIGVPGQSRYNMTCQLASNIFFLDQVITVSGDAATRKKATGGDIRVIRTGSSAAYEAKRRYVIPETIEFLPQPDGSVDLEKNARHFFTILKEGRSKAK